MASADLEQALGELYGAPLEQFMETRDALTKKLKAAGDKDGAAELKKQHKPTQVAHALNLLSRQAQGELEALFDAGRALASGKDFKASLERQRVALDAVKKKASGPDVPAIIAVVQGALVDEKLAAAVRAGRFAKLPEVPVGFFGAAPEGAPPVVLPPREEPKKLTLVPKPPPSAPRPSAPPPSAPPPSAPPPSSPPKPKRNDSLEKELAAAEKEAAEAAGEVGQLERELVEAKHRAHEAAETVAKLKKRLNS